MKDNHYFYVADYFNLVPGYPILGLIKLIDVHNLQSCLPDGCQGNGTYAILDTKSNIPTFFNTETKEQADLIIEFIKNSEILFI